MKDGSPPAAKRLGNILPDSFQNGLYKPVSAYGAGVPIIRINDFDNEGRFTSTQLSRLNLSDDEIERFGLRVGDILINRVNSLSHVGKSLLITELTEPTVYESNMMRLRIGERPEIIPDYVAYIIQSEKTRTYLRGIAKPAIAQASINQDDVKSVLIPIYPINNQKQISEYLCTWDKAIKIMERVVYLKVLQYQSLCKKLLNYDHYSKRSLMHFLKLVLRDVVKPNNPYCALGIRSHGKGTFHRSIEDPSTVAMESLFQVRRDDLIVNITFAWEGAVALVHESDEDCLVSHRFPTYVIDRSKALPDYLRHVIVQKRFIHDLGLISPGGAGRNRVLSKQDFLRLRIPLPGLSEQQRIADILNTSQVELVLLQRKLAALQKQKRGLMQKLLTGKWRVRTSKEDGRG